MSSRLAFQTQLASIMEVLANAAVAEICKLVDDDYAVVSLQMSQCQRENKALKRKLHLLELKMARGNAERRLRESAMNSCRPRVQINGSDRPRETSPSTVAIFDHQVDVALWPSRNAAEDAASDLTRSEIIQRKSPDVELVEPEAVLVKEEKEEANTSHTEETQEGAPLVGDEDEVECVPYGAVGQRPSIEQQDTQSTSSQSQIPSSKTWRPGSGGRGVEEDEDQDVVLVKVEDMEQAPGTRSKAGLSIQEGLVESSTDDYKAVLPFDETTQTSTNQLPDLQESGRGFSEPAAPQSTPVTSRDSDSAAAVQLRAPDTNTPAGPGTQQQRSSSHSSGSSEYSLFELETFFTRWAPDNASAPGGPSCSFAAYDSAGSDQDGVIVIENDTQPQQGLQQPRGSGSSAARLSGGQRFCSASDSRGHVPPLLQPAGPSGSSPWRRTSAMIKSAQAQLLQRRHGSDETTVTSISSTSRSVGSAGAVPVRGTTAAFSSIAAQQQARLLAPSLAERRKKSYVCRVCGKAFSGLSNLEAHERVHTGEKPFRCDTCGKRFSEAGNLKKHQRVHTGEKPFSCDQCGKRFAWICNLRTHQHSGSCCEPQARGGLGLG